MTVKELSQLSPKEAKKALEGLPVLDIVLLVHLSEPEYICELGNDDEFIAFIGPLLRNNQEVRNHAKLHGEHVNSETRCRCRDAELLK